MQRKAPEENKDLSSWSCMYSTTGMKRNGIYAYGKDKTWGDEGVSTDRMRMSSQGGIMGYRAMGISESYRWPEGKSKAHGWIF